MKLLKLRRAVSLAVVLLSLTGAVVMAGTIPSTLNYQGTFTDSAGKPVSATAKPVSFSLYTTALGGTPFWTEPQAVTISNGQFSAVLGSTIPLPIEKFTGETYVGVTVDGQEMLPRQKMTSVPYALKAADAIPKRVIVMWSGALDQIPEGWALCDGKNGTPNLTDKFIVAAGNKYAVGAGGGSETHAHYDDHVHHMDFFTYNDPTGSDYDDSVSDGSDKTPAGSEHRHHIQADTWGKSTGAYTGQASSLPPFYALAYIMKL